MIDLNSFFNFSDLIDSNKNSSIWGKTFGQAISWMNKNTFQSNENHSGGDSAAGGQSIAPQSIPLNAYLTYVTLKLQVIMQGKWFFHCFQNV